MCVISHGSLGHEVSSLNSLNSLSSAMCRQKQLKKSERETGWRDCESDCCHVWCDNESNPPGELHTCSLHISWLNGKVNGNGNRCTGKLCGCSHVHKRPEWDLGGMENCVSVSMWLGARLQIDPQFSEDKNYLERHKNKRLRFSKRS